MLQPTKEVPMFSQQITTPLARLWQSFEHAMKDRAVMRDIDRMDERMLKDLGLSRAQAEFQATHRRNDRPE